LLCLTVRVARHGRGILLCGRRGLILGSLILRGRILRDTSLRGIASAAPAPARWRLLGQN
jgi:hypothetical protein